LFTLSDVDFAQRFIIVRRQYRNGIEKKTKTKKLRKVDISDALLQELQALKKLRMKNCLADGKNEIPASVFLSPGKRLPDGKREIGTWIISGTESSGSPATRRRSGAGGSMIAATLSQRSS